MGGFTRSREREIAFCLVSALSLRRQARSFRGHSMPPIPGRNSVANCGTGTRRDLLQSERRHAVDRHAWEQRLFGSASGICGPIGTGSGAGTFLLEFAARGTDVLTT